MNINDNNIANIITHDIITTTNITNNKITINYNACMARLKSNPNKQCSRCKKANSDFCGLHMNKNVMRIDEPISIIIKKCKDTVNKKKKYKIDYEDLLNKKCKISKYSYVNIKHNIQLYKLEDLKNKKKNFTNLTKHLRLLYDTKYTYIHHLHKLLLISKLVRGRYIRNINKLKGPGFLNTKHINNETDFLHFTDVKDIKYNNFISYKEDCGIIYAFQIDSLIIYIEELKKNKYKKATIKNPYTRNRFSKKFLKNLFSLDKIHKDIEKKKNTSINNINSLNVINNVNTVHNINSIQPVNNSYIHNRLYSKYANLEPEIRNKHICVDIFQRMDELELYTQPSWFLNLSIFKLKKLYFYMEDIWHFRSRLSRELKKNYVTNGKAFVWPYRYIRTIIDKTKLQSILLYEFSKFVYEGKTKDDCITASYWILTGLTMVSSAAAAGCPALVYNRI